MRSSVRPVRADTSSAARAALNAASACGTVSGSIPRAFLVATAVEGTHATGTMRSDGSTRSTEIAPASVVHATVTPPYRHAATLSGCPSSSLASARRASSGNRSSPPTTRARARMSPAMIAAADDPRPRPCGILLAHTRSRPRGRPPNAVNPLSIALATRCRWSRGTPSAPSPWTSTRIPASSETWATTSSYRARAAPNASKPGPRLAEVAGTRTRVAAARNVGRPLGTTFTRGPARPRRNARRQPRSWAWVRPRWPTPGP